LAINQPTIRILSIVEATTINAVAKNVLEFHRAAQELASQSADFPRIEACLVTFARDREPASSATDFVNAARKLELEVEIINERRRLDLAAITALKSVVDKKRPDVVVTHSVKSHFLLWRSQVWRELPWVAFHHGYTTTDLKMRVYNRADRWSLPHARKIVTVCHAFARELAEHTGVAAEQIAVHPNSIRPEPKPAIADVLSLRNRLGIADDERIVLTVGRLSREKAQSDLLAAFKHLRDTHPEISLRLIIVGDGPERERLEAVTRADGRGELVIFTGQRNDVELFYAAADVFALPSHSEGSPYVLLEAMAANLPIVATSVGGVPEILTNNETALLVPVNDPPATAAAIERVLTDGELAQRLTVNSAYLVSEKYTPHNYARSLVDLYRKVIDARSPSSRLQSPNL
jgi:glycosyltransferase involved in cell wall biosynthesis